MSIICIGDSLTYGRVGYSYIPFLKTPEEVINKGLNGDTTLCALKRLKKILSQPRYHAVDTYIVGIGTNDILLPYIASLSPLWRLQMTPKCKAMKCITNNKTFAASYEKYLKLLSKHNKKVILLGLPYIQLAHFPLKTVKERNRIIEKLALQYNYTFIDTYAAQLDLVPRPKLYSWHRRNLLHFIDSSIMTVFPPAKDWFERKRQLGLTVDGIHFTALSAGTLAQKINEYLLLEIKKN